MTEDSLKTANELKQSLNKSAGTLSEVELWKEHHENNDKDLSLSFGGGGKGWVTIPAETKQEVLNLVHDIALKLHIEAKDKFDNYQPV